MLRANWLCSDRCVNMAVGLHSQFLGELLQPHPPSFKLKLGLKITGGVPSARTHTLFKYNIPPWKNPTKLDLWMGSCHWGAEIFALSLTKKCSGVFGVENLERWERKLIGNNRTRATCGTKVIVSLSNLHLSHVGSARLRPFKKPPSKRRTLPEVNDVDSFWGVCVSSCVRLQQLQRCSRLTGHTLCFYLHATDINWQASPKPASRLILLFHLPEWGLWRQECFVQVDQSCGYGELSGSGYGMRSAYLHHQ